MGLFEDIYNTVARFFRPQELPEGEDTKSVATNRLKLVLMQDRTNLTPRILEQMRSELIDLLSRYVELDKELLELNFEQEGEQVALMLSIPVIRAKDEDEIEAAIKEHQEAILQENSDVSDENDESEDEDSDFEEDSDVDLINNQEDIPTVTAPDEMQPKSEEILGEKTEQEIAQE